MSKVLKLLQTSDCSCNCKIKMENINGYEKFEKILEDNKDRINFVFTDYKLFDKYGNKYGDFINKHFDEVTHALCLSCLWHVIKNYNDEPIGNEILCCN